MNLSKLCLVLISVILFTQCKTLVKIECMDYQTTDEDYISILEKHINALGGKENILKVKNIYYQYSFKGMGMTGTIKNWCQGDSLFRGEDHFGKETDIDIIRNNINWNINSNGVISKDTIENISVDRLFSSFQYILYKSNNAKYVRGKQVKEDGKDLIPIIITVEDSSSIVLLIDSKTYLVHKIKRLDRGKVLTTILSDYREINGVKIPFNLKSILGLSLFKYTEIVEDVKTNQSYPANLFFPPKNIAKIYIFPDNVDYITIPFEFIYNKIVLVKASVNNNSSEYFLFDTGAGSTVVDKEYMKKLGVSIKGEIPVRTLDGYAETGRAEIDLFSLSDLQIENVTFGTMDISENMKLPDKKIVGILGGDILSMFVLKVNFDEKLITLYEKENFIYKGDGEILDISVEQNIPVIKACLNDSIFGNFTVDMGATGSIYLFGEIINKCDLLKNKDKLFKAEALGAGGKVELYYTRMNEIHLGRFKIKNLPTALIIKKGIAEERPGRDGNIGTELLSHFNIYLDYQKKHIILEKSNNFGKPVILDKSGIKIIKKENKFIADRVFKNTPAYEAGLKEKDELISINGNPVSDYTLQETEGILKGNIGEKIDLLVKRNKKEFKISFFLREYI